MEQLLIGLFAGCDGKDALLVAVLIGLGCLYFKLRGLEK